MNPIIPLGVMMVFLICGTFIYCFTAYLEHVSTRERLRAEYTPQDNKQLKEDVAELKTKMNSVMIKIGFKL